MLQFSMPDANDVVVTLVPGRDFTTYWQILQTAEEVAYNLGGHIGQRVPVEIRHSWRALDVWGPDDLARYCITVELVDDPPEPRRLIRKSLVQERVNAIGKLGDAFALLNADPLAFGRWFAPDWPNVYVDDEGLLSVLTAIGCTAEEIEAITAPVQP